MKFHLFTILILISIFLFCLCSCGKTDESAQMIAPVTAFYDAIVKQERDRVGAIACGEWEKDALRDVDSFMGVSSEMKDFSCSVESVEGDTAFVKCTGAIAASYGAEVTEFPLDRRSHKVVKEQGDWRICGY